MDLLQKGQDIVFDLFWRRNRMTGVYHEKMRKENTHEEISFANGMCRCHYYRTL
jgi:hypothetical protein